MVPTLQEGKAPWGHLSTPMKWDDQREQVRKKLIQRLLHNCWDPLPQPPRCFFEEIFEGTVRPWGVMMWCQNCSVESIAITSLHPGHSGHFSVALGLQIFCLFLCLMLKSYFKCSWYGAKHSSCLGTGEPIKCTLTWHHIPPTHSVDANELMRFKM